MHEGAKFTGHLGETADRCRVRDITGDRFHLRAASCEDFGHLRDGGPPLEEAVTAMPDTDSENGRGLALARVALDDLEYERVDGHNEWTMVRRRR